MQTQTKTASTSDIARNVILSTADENGVFATTKTLKALMKKGLSRGAASGSIFGWSDPVGDNPGVRRVRLNTRRYSAKAPNERADTATLPVTVKPTTSKPSGSLPDTNTKGPFYISPRQGKGPKDGRKKLLLEQLFARADPKTGEFRLQTVVNKLADLGFNPHSTYKTVRDVTAREKYGFRVTKDKFGTLSIRKTGVVKKEDPVVKTDHLVTPNSFKGAKTQEQIDAERAAPTVSDLIARWPEAKANFVRPDTIIDLVLDTLDVEQLRDIVKQHLITEARHKTGL